MQTVTNIQPLSDLVNKEIDALELAKYMDNARTNKYKANCKDGLPIDEKDEAEMYYLLRLRNVFLESKGVFFFED